MRSLILVQCKGTIKLDEKISPKKTYRWPKGTRKHSLNYQRNANQNYIRYHLTLVRMAIIKKSTNYKCWRRCGEKGILLHYWRECKLIWTLWRYVSMEPVWTVLKKTKNRTTPVLGIYPEKIRMQKNTCTLKFIAALFTIARTWTQSKCPSTDE